MTLDFLVIFIALISENSNFYKIKSDKDMCRKSQVLRSHIFERQPLGITSSLQAARLMISQCHYNGFFQPF